MILITTLVAVGLAFLMAAIVSNIGMESQVAAAQQQDDEIYRMQETGMSTAAPVAHTGSLPHAVVYLRCL